jgi:predicted Ser/Thr protein kinase
MDLVLNQGAPVSGAGVGASSVDIMQMVSGRLYDNMVQKAKLEVFERAEILRREGINKAAFQYQISNLIVSSK